MSMHAAMLDDCRELVKLSCRNFEDYFEVKKRIATERELLMAKSRGMTNTTECEPKEGMPVRDPKRAKHKGCCRRVLTSKGKFRRVQRCRKCGKTGHNARKCDYVGNGGTQCSDNFEGTNNMASEEGEFDAADKDVSF
ncbi:hypothetical protein PIB30_100906 [Stylosanthes scabra]|uniref:CCHC-type domain-containing protein n=1 Tax=Stylosanthes scabra TaxID=79078 RepID=A0ABU6VVQ5_9FABA|nr:hypothetical protein [Stylosanthes scabra]